MKRFSERPLLLFIVMLIASSLEARIGWQMRVDGEQKIHSEEEFESVALSWSASHDVRVRVRSSDDGARWSEWTDAAIDSDASDRSEGRYVTGIIHLGHPVRHLEVDAGESIATLNATMFPPQRRRRAVPEPNSLPVGSLMARSRVDWGCPAGERAPLWTPAYTTVTHLVVHHTAGANSVADWSAEVRSIWYLHTYTNGWGDIGYNYLIDPNGVIYEGRAGGQGAIGAHFSCRNTNTAGISLLGTYTTTLPTAAALDSLKRLLAELCAKNHIDPTAFALHVPSGLNVPTIIGHRDGNPSTLTCTRTEMSGQRPSIQRCPPFVPT